MPLSQSLAYPTPRQVDLTVHGSVAVAGPSLPSLAEAVRPGEDFGDVDDGSAHGGYRLTLVGRNRQKMQTVRVGRTQDIILTIHLEARQSLHSAWQAW